jgi:hypothetical protein
MGRVLVGMRPAPTVDEDIIERTMTKYNMSKKDS